MQARPSATVVVFGEAMIELAELRADTARLGVGGDTFNTAVYLARAGVRTSYATALGADPFSHRIEALLAAEGIGMDCVLTVPERGPGLYAIDVDARGERSFTYWRSASAVRAFFDAPDAGAAVERLVQAPWLYLSGISLSLFCEHDPHPLVELARAVRRNGGKVVFDTNYRPRGWPSCAHARAIVEALMPSVSLALPTFEDEQALFGDVQPEACLARWLDAGVEEVAVKCGPRGALVGGHGWVPPPRVIEPLDTTGAGDSFNAAYLAARFGGATPPQAAMAGHALAAVVIRHAGAIVPRA